MPILTVEELSVTAPICCVCGDEIFNLADSAFDTCEDCLDNVMSDPEAFLERAFASPAEQHEPGKEPIAVS